MNKKRFFIYGSCVSRDTSEFLSPDEATLVGYIARQSLISINRNCLSFWPQNYKLKSAFQQRLVSGDWRGDALLQIEQAAADGLDVLVLDFTDERFGIYEFNDQAIVTRSIDMMRTQLEKTAKSNAVLHELGSEQHVRWWHWCLMQFANRLKELDLFDKTVVLKVPWATQTDAGKKLGSRMGMTPQQANKFYERYYYIAEREGFQVIDLSDFPVHAEPLHQWGLAPYHYTLDVYEEIARQLRIFWEK